MTRKSDRQATAILAAAGAFTAALGDEALAGEVTVRRAGRNVFIEGGSGEDAVTLTGGGDGVLRLEGGMGTSFPGGGSAVDVPVGRRDRVTVALGGADGDAADFVEIRGTLPALRGIRVFAGNDRYATVAVRNADVPCDLHVDSRGPFEPAGAYTSIVDARIRGLLIVDGDDTSDTLVSSNVTLESGLRAVFRGGGNDFSYVGINNLQCHGDAVIESGSTRDIVHLNECEFRGKLSISSGDGDDSVSLYDSSVAGTTKLRLGRDASTDQLTSEGMRFAKKLTVETGDGGGGTLFAGTCTLEGGASISTRGGADTIWIAGGVLRGKPVRLLGGAGDDRIWLTGAEMQGVAVETVVIADGEDGNDTLEAGGASLSGRGRIVPVSIETDLTPDD